MPDMGFLSLVILIIALGLMSMFETIDPKAESPIMKGIKWTLCGVIVITAIGPILFVVVMLLHGYFMGW